MAAAVTAQRHGLSVIVADDQRAPGGQIWRSIEQDGRRDHILGPAYVEGRRSAAAFRQSGVEYRSGAKIWQIEDGFRVFLSEGGTASIIRSKALLLATGAQERPVPFPGWTLPGVLTVGAGQILLKSAGEIPDAPVWIAGTGPLPLLYAVQLMKAGGRIAGFLDTTPRGQWMAAARLLPRALLAAGDLAKGIRWQSQLRTSGTLVVGGVEHLEAIGGERLEAIRYRTAKGKVVEAAASVLLVHEGVVPSIHPALSLGCRISWNEGQDSFAPEVDEWGETSRPGVFVAGDGAGIAGAKAAELRGRLAALRIAERAGRLDAAAAIELARPERRRLARELAARPFLDALFRPRRSIFTPSNETVVCRCEGVTAGEIKGLAVNSSIGPNQIKAASRTGMGPCQGRQCGYTVTRLIAEAQCRTPEQVGFLNIRPPLRPVTLRELASLEEGAGS